MNWIQENKMLASILAIMGIGVLGLSAWLYVAYGAYSSAKANFSTVSAEITALESARLYPNRDNVTAKTTKVKAYEEQLGKLREVLLVNQQAVKPISETDFQARLKERSNDISLRAKRADAKLPDNFALGFDEYTGSLPKSPEQAAELNLHLDVMEKLVGTIVDSGVKQLESITRTKLPSEKGATAPAVPPPLSVKAAPKGKGKTSAAGPVVNIEPALDRYAIRLQFKCDQAPLQNVLNTIANPNPKIMPYLMVVRLLRIDNSKKDAPTKAEVAEKLRNLTDVTKTQAPVTPAGATATATVTALPPDTVAIMGDETLLVQLEVDYIRLRDQVKNNLSAGGAKN